MIIRTQSGGILKPPVECKADSLVVCLDDGTPIAVALDIDKRVWMYTSSDPQFEATMETLGFNKRDLPKVEVVKV